MCWMKPKLIDEDWIDRCGLISIDLKNHHFSLQKIHKTRLNWSHWTIFADSALKAAYIHFKCHTINEMRVEVDFLRIRKIFKSIYKPPQIDLMFDSVISSVNLTLIIIWAALLINYQLIVHFLRIYWIAQCKSAQSYRKVIFEKLTKFNLPQTETLGHSFVKLNLTWNEMQHEILGIQQMKSKSKLKFMITKYSCWCFVVFFVVKFMSLHELR